MSKYVNENTMKLSDQNQHFDNVFAGLQEMIKALHRSMEDINMMGEAHNNQSQVVKNTITINKDIADNIIQENEEFSNINSMVASNAKDIQEMTEQIHVVNSMVDEINKLLN